MDTSSRRVFAASYDLTSAATGGERISALVATLDTLVPADLTGWVDMQLDGRSTTVLTGAGPERPAVVAGLSRTVAQHPVTQVMRAHPTRVDPIRISDVMSLSDWLRHPVVNETSRLTETTFQLSVPVLPFESGRIRAWVFNRGRTDFSDDTVRLSVQLQPLLAAIDRLEGVTHPAVTVSVAESARLTAREDEILHLLSVGLTSRQIAALIRIQPSTVSKHIEHIYSKLGVHDRVSATRTAMGRE